MITRPLIALLAFTALAGTTLAQTPAKKPTKPTTKTTDPNKEAQKQVELSQDVFRLETVGLSVNLPIGATAQKSRIGEQVTGQITAAPGGPQWLLNIQTPQSSKEGITARQVAAEVLEQVRAQFGVTDDQGKTIRTAAEVIEPVGELRFGLEGPRSTTPPARFYVKTPTADKKTAVVRGYTVLSLGKGRFIVFDFTAPEAAFASVRPTYEAMIATARLEDPSQLSQIRGALVERGVNFLSTLTTAQIDEAIVAMDDRWFRLYTPSTTGSDADATENGYIRIRAWKGARAEIEQAKPKGSAEPDGYLVRLEARQLAGEQTVDSIGFYYVSTDRTQELWNLQLAVRDAASNRVTQTQTETGARSGTSMSVSIGGSGESRSVQPFVPERGYLSQVETFLLPILLARTQAEGPAREIGFYAYQSEFSNVRFRKDATRLDENRAGAIRVTTQLNEDAEPFMSLFNSKGELIQTTLATGAVRVPIELPRLVDVWKGKGLPVE